MNIVTRETKEKSLQAIREKISKATDSKERHALGSEAKQLRKEISQAPR